MTLEQYIQKINQSYRSKIATEHTYRSDLKNLIEAIVPDISATNEPKRIKCGAPDYVLTKDEIPVGFIEAKDIADNDLAGKKKTGNKEQFDRYKASLNNLIFTDYLDFHLYIDGEFKTSVRIGEIENGNIIPLPNNFSAFNNLIKDFVSTVSQTITNSRKLAEMMAGKARMLSDVIEKALTSDEEVTEDSTLKEQMEAFKQILIHDITPQEFADVYAQTIAYGMFAARLHDKSLNTFTRQEAAELIPKSNPFLRKLFGYIAGPDIDDRIKWIVDSLATIFRATDIKALLKDFGKSTQTRDPMIHFYETFLSEYDPKLRKARGVWYTPEPVVNFIVRAVDDILKTEFNLPNGLADTSKTTIKVKTQTKDGRSSEGVKLADKEVHKVQILDPATGTGTFLAEVIKHIHQKFAGQQGIWSNYVENHLIPRINGFELLMASYAMAHLKLDLLLTETGYRNASYQPPRLSATSPSQRGEFLDSKSSPPDLGGVSAGRGGQRLQIYLTNSLEEYHPETGTLWASWLSAEANEANHIKRDTPVMCVIGNPPYSGESQNKGKWIMDLMEDYKKEPGGKEKLKEKNPKWINADEYKFIRFAQHFIEKNGEGVLAFINPHSFLDNPTFRGMRWNLLKTFDKIYILDLHGNSKKKETAPDGSPDVNVFDIMQGVLNIFIKTGKKKPNELGKVFHYDLFGKRDVKYNFLNDNSIKTVNYEELKTTFPDYSFKYFDNSLVDKYNNGINPLELFSTNVMGFQTHRDNFAIGWNRSEIENRAKAMLNLQILNDEISSTFQIKDNRDWKLSKAREEIQKDIRWRDKVATIGYRPFDNRLSYFSYVMMDYPRRELIQHVLNKDNLLIGIGRQGLAVGDIEWCLATVAKHPVDANMFRRGGVNLFPLYLYPNKEVNKEIEEGITPSLFSNTPDLEGVQLDKVNRVPNLNLEIVKQIADKLQLTFTNEKETTHAPSSQGGELFLNTPSLETEKNLIEKATKSSPPDLGGVSAGRGGNFQINNLPYLKTFRKELRNSLTPAEARFWKVVQNSNFEGRKFRRQHSVGNYILDFYCPSEKLAIELDGEVHFNDSAREYDYERKLFLEHFGIKVIRFENKRVFEDLEWMLDVIKSNFGWNKGIEPPRPADTPPFKGGELLSEKSQIDLELKAEIKDSIEETQPLNTKTLSSSPLKGGEAESAGVVSSPQKMELLNETFAPIDLLDYIYAVLHSPTYREKYKEFLKIDFPRVPYPKDKETFWQLVALGGELRQIHLLESPTVENYITQYPIDGDNIVGKVRFELQPLRPTDTSSLKGEELIEDINKSSPLDLGGVSAGRVGNFQNTGKVWINETQYFDNVPQIAWDFYIGGYQPAQKWLKDRKERTLDFDDIFHYQKIIVALTETDRLMKEIDKIEIE